MSGLASAWDPAPAVLVGAGLTARLFVRGFVRLRRRGRADHADWPRLALFLLAVALGTLALVSPLDEIGDSYLLSGHMLQHVLIGDVAPALALVALRGPLLFFLLPGPLLGWLARMRWLRALLGFLLRPTVSLAVWMTVVGAWHVPAAYDYALDHQAVHDLEHLSFILAGVLVWMQIVDPARRQRLRVEQRVGCMAAMFGAGAVLAGVLLFSPAPLYPTYGGAFGTSALHDQQLAGVAMFGEQLLALGLCCWFLLRGGELASSPSRSSTTSRASAAASCG